jgi:hypothetical protein
MCRLGARFGAGVKKRTATQWSKILGVSTEALYHRMKRFGKNDPRVFTRGKMKSTGRPGILLATPWGTTIAVKAARKLGISKQAMSERLKRGWSEKRATTVPKYGTTRAPRACKKCGKLGHYAKTCGKKRRRGS